MSVRQNYGVRARRCHRQHLCCSPGSALSQEGPNRCVWCSDAAKRQAHHLRIFNSFFPLNQRLFFVLHCLDLATPMQQPESSQCNPAPAHTFRSTICSTESPLTASTVRLSWCILVPLEPIMHRVVNFCTTTAGPKLQVVNSLSISCANPCSKADFSSPSVICWFLPEKNNNRERRARRREFVRHEVLNSLRVENGSRGAPPAFKAPPTK